MLRVKSLGLSVQAYPADGGLPSLAPCCDVRPHGALFEALQSAAHVVLDGAWQLVHATAKPVRYKPGNRCVIRYELLLERG